MIILLTLIHIVVCLFLVIVVLLQSGKAADLAGAFGGMGSQTAFGPRGAATILSKATTIAAVLFMITSLSLSIMQTRRAGTGGTSSVLDRAPVQQKKAATPAPAPAPSGTPAQPGSTAPIPVRVGEGPVKPGQPSVTLTPEGGGPSRTYPLEIPPQPGTPAPKSGAQPPPARPEGKK
ncbi:MAG TPA: preprotein translocase subunit SecG [Terriglobales bacterium]|jgi:preprotein translocase subunit SecG